jgi:small nuclear ribonucleoprotein (snRNP)-like protein
MKVKSIALITLVLALLLNSIPASAAQNNSSEWGAVQALASGEKVKVELKDGKKVEGRLLQVSNTSLTIDRKNKPTDFSRDSIAKVYRLVQKLAGKSIAKSAAIGAGIGFGGGLGVSLAAGNYEDLGTAELIGVLGGIGAAIGAGIGALAGSFGKHQRRELIYQSN